jgi:hypothetical protein
MNELYTDTLVLRSEQMKQRFSSDDRFAVLTREDPWLVLRLKDSKTQLVDVVDVPVSTMPRDGWMNRAFSRFRLAHPYHTREIYLHPDQVWQTPSPAKGGDVRVISMERERLVFETSAIGQPHVIRMSFHPKWRSVTGEPIFLTEPAFMLIVPKQSRVELRYAPGPADHIGAWLTVVGLIALLWALIAPKASHGPITAQGPALIPTMAVLSIMISGAAWSWWNNPERSYELGHKLFSEEQYLAASHAFDRAYEARTVPGKRAEALFWEGRSLELGGADADALERFKNLVTLYPDSYWAAESLYRVVRLERGAKNPSGAKAAYDKLLQHFPGDKWTQKATEELGTQN